MYVTVTTEHKGNNSGACVWEAKPSSPNMMRSTRPCPHLKVGILEALLGGGSLVAAIVQLHGRCGGSENRSFYVEGSTRKDEEDHYTITVTKGVKCSRQEGACIIVARSPDRQP
jgi:hypothetical protein